MREVRSCDFCGDDATGLYEPLPASIPDGPRMSLCPGCRDRLASVVDPLVERLEADVDASSTGHSTPDERRSVADPTPSVDSSGDAELVTPATAPEDVEVSESRDASGRPQRERAGTPPGYRKVMRFLENRQLPIEREKAERLAAEAYDLASADVARAIDHAVQYGRLREVDGELKR